MVTLNQTAEVMSIYVTKLKIRTNISENKQCMGLKFCLAQYVMDKNLVLEYQKNMGKAKKFLL